MAQDTLISWADSTCNFWIGCTKLSPACDFCYAEKLNDTRLQRTTWGPHGERAFIKAGWEDARRFERQAKKNRGKDPKLGRRRRVFVNSLSDFFDNHKSIVWRDDAWKLMRECPNVIFMLLTKRPENIAKMLPADWDHGYENVWIGTTVEDETRAWQRIRHLIRIPARVRFLSCEPLLGEIPVLDIIQSAQAALSADDMLRRMISRWGGKQFIHWIIAGGESGARARPMHPDWVRSLRDQARTAGIAFHFKQWGEWIRYGEIDADGDVNVRDRGEKPGLWHVWEHSPEASCRVGAKQAGNHIDGRQWLEFPREAA